MEFAAVSVFLVPLLLGVVSFGLNLSRTLQVTQAIRDVGHMYCRWIDFSLVPNQDIAVRLTQGLGMTRTGGSGVLILSKVTYIVQADCDAKGLTAAQCTNVNQYVVANRIVIGNASFHSSAFGTPTALEANGDVKDYMKDSMARATNFGTTLVLKSGEWAYVSEGFFNGISWAVPGYNVGNAINGRSIF